MTSLRKIFQQVPGLCALYPPRAAYATLRKCLETPGQENTLRALLKTYPDAVRWEKPGDMQPLDYALWRKQTGSAAELIAADKTILADLNKAGHTPLMHTAVRSYTDSVTFLLEHGADVDAVNAEGNTALHLCAGHQLYWQAIAPLIAGGADVKKTNAQGETPLQIAAAQSGPGFLQLMKHDTDSKQRDRFGKTLLIRAAENGNLNATKELLKAGADPKEKCNRGMNALIYAMVGLQEDCVIALLEHGMTVDITHPRIKDMIARNDGYDPFTPVLEQQKEKKAHAALIEKNRVINGNIETLRNGTTQPIKLRRVTFVKKPPFK